MDLRDRGMWTCVIEDCGLTYSFEDCGLTHSWNCGLTYLRIVDSYYVLEDCRLDFHDYGQFTEI